MVQLSKENPQLLDAGITGYFFFQEKEKELGKAKLIGFFDFFKVCLSVFLFGYEGINLFKSKFLLSCELTHAFTFSYQTQKVVISVFVVVDVNFIKYLISLVLKI